MRWASTLSREPETADALAEAVEALRRELGGEAPALVVAFSSVHHADALERLAPAVRERLGPALVVGATAGGVIGAAREAEEGPALSLTAAALPGVTLKGFHLPGPGLPSPGRWPDAFADLAGSSAREQPRLLLLADPFTTDVAALLAGLDRAWPGQPKFGGLASGGRRPGENRLLLGGAVHRGGAVGVAFRGDVEVDTLVAQGCRPVGPAMVITRCRGGLLEALDGRPALQVLRELHAGLPARDRELMGHSLFLGLEMRPESVDFAPDELLVRNLLGADQASGALAVGAELRQLQAARFVLRDAHAAEEELRRLLDAHRRRPGAAAPAGALLFSCVGRGAGLFGCPDHDTGLFAERFAGTPLGGFFCNGEIGPVGGSTWLHGYTSAFALFRPAGVPG